MTRWSRMSLIAWFLSMVVGFVGLPDIALAGCLPSPPYWDDQACISYLPAPWPAENAWIPYQNQGQSINDPRVLDPSNGGTRPQNYVNVSSGCPDEELPSIYWSYDSGSQVLFFRWRVEQIGNKYATGPGPGAYSDSDPWFAALWTVFIDIDGDGYREFAFHIDGSSGTPSARVDILRSIYSNTKSQRIDYNSDPLNIHSLFYNPAAFIDQSTEIILNFQNRVTPLPSWPNGSAETVWDYGTTRSINISTATCNEFFVDYQIPLGMMNAAPNGPTLTADTPIAMYFATANSLNDPLQKDWVQATGNSCTGPDCCLSYGDLLTLNGGFIPQPVIDWVTAEGCKPTKLTAQVRDALVDPCGTTLLSVRFFYYFDRNGNGVADDPGSSWTEAIDGANSPDAVSTWTATWETSGLPEGEYLIGVRAEDQQRHITWTFLNQAQVNSLGLPVPQTDPPTTYYPNPLPIPGVVYDSFINTCGKGADVTTSVFPNSVLIGQTVQFTITVTNYDDVPLTLNSISDDLPPGFSYNSSFTETGTLASSIATRPLNGAGTPTWTFSTLPPTTIPANGGSRTLTFTANVSNVTGTYTNVAHANTDEQGTLTSNPVDVGVGVPRLTIQKSANVLFADPGQTITYTIKYSNNSPVSVTGVTITDPLPEGFTFVSASNGGVYNSSTRSITWNIGNLTALEGPYSISFTGTVDTENVPPTLINTATIRSNETPSIDSSVNVAINTPLAIRKTANPILVNPGSNVVFTINYINNSFSQKTGVSITDVIPAGFTYVSNIGGGSYTDSTRTVTWIPSNPPDPPGILRAGASGSVSLTVQALNPYTESNPVLNTATIVSAQTSPVSDSAEVSINACSNPTQYYFRNLTANVGSDGTRGIANTTMGGSTQQAASLVNAEFIRFYMDPPAASAYSFAATVSFWADKISGPNPAAIINLFDYNPSGGSTVLLATGTSGVITGGIKLYTVSLTGSLSLAPGHRLLWTFSGNADTFYFRYDGPTADKGDSFSSICLTPLNFSMDKSVDKIAAAPGDSLAYRIQFGNPSLTSATGAEIIDTLPAGITLNTGGPNRPSLNGTLLNLGTDYTCAGQVCTFNVNSAGALPGVIASGATGSLVINATVNNPLAPNILSLLNTAELRTNQTPPLTDSAITRVTSSNPALSIVKSASKTLLIPGDTVTFTLTVINSGLSTATNVLVTDNLSSVEDAYFTYDPGSASNSGIYSSGTITWNLGNMTSGQSQVLTFRMVVGPSSPPPGVTTKNNSAMAVDQMGSHASNVVTVAISLNANLQITKTGSLVVDNNGNGKVNPGDTLEYTITVTNIGGSSAENVLVRDPIPANTSYKNGSLIDGVTSRTDANDADNAYFDAVHNRVMFNIGTLGVAGSLTMKFRVIVDSLANGTTPISNTATVSASNTASKQASATINAEAAPLLSLRKNAPATVPYPLTTLTSGVNGTTIPVVSTQFIAVGDIVFFGATMAKVLSVDSATQFTVDQSITANMGSSVDPTFNLVFSYSNTGNTDATNAQVRDVLPAGLNYVSASPTPASAPAFNTNGTVTWNLGTLPPGATESLSMRVRPTAGGMYLNTGSMSSTEVPSFNSNTTITVLGAVLLSKSTSTPNVTNTDTGATATYTITLTNQTTTPSSNNVTVTDSLPAGFTYASTTGTPCTTLPSEPSVVTINSVTYTCVFSHVSSADNQPGLGANWRTYWVQKGTGGTAWASPTSYTAQNKPVWSGCTLGSQGTLTITFNVNIAQTVGGGTYQNPVSATSPVLSIMPFYELDTTSEDVTVSVPNDLAVTKEIQSLSSPCNPGTCEVTFLITVENVGTALENGVQVKDLLPAGLTYKSSNSTNYNSGTGIWTVGTLSASSWVTLLITASVDVNAVVQNCAELSASSPADTNPANNKGCASVYPTRAFLSCFGAYDDQGRVIVQWETSSEMDTAGFYLFRLNEATNQYEPVHDRMLTAMIDSPQGGTYRFIDSGAATGKRHTYLLLEVEFNGKKREHGPFLVSVENQPPAQSFSLKPMNGAFAREAHPMSLAKKARIKAIREAKDAASSAKKSTSAEQAKIAVSKSGIYYLPSSDVSRVLGIPVETVKRMIGNKQFSLSSQGQQVSYLADKERSGLYFYGQGVESVYTLENIYWLSKVKGLLMETIEGKGPLPSAGIETFADAKHFEEDQIPAVGLASDPLSDYWLWDYVTAGDREFGEKSFSFRAAGVGTNPGSASLIVRLQGGTDSGTGADHHAVFALNGKPIGETRWTKASRHDVTLSFNQNLLNEGDNHLTVTGLLDGDVPYSIFFINSFDLIYQRFYQAVDGAFLCRGDGNAVVTISGFLMPDILLFDVTSPNKPRLVKAATVDGAAGKYRVSFTPSSPEAVYVAVSASSVPSGFNLLAETPSSLKAKQNKADYLIITTAELKDAAQSLANYRQGQGLKTMVVLLEDIMDEFNYGILDAETIRNFLSYAFLHWKKAPAYVVLAGEGTYDYKDRLGFGDNLIPPMMVVTPFGLFPSDNYFADTDGDHIPEISIGRLPVATPQEMTELIQKIIAYEKADATDWGKKVIMLADNPDNGGNFTGDSDDLASLLPGQYSPLKIYHSERPIDDARQLLFNGLNGGTALLNYFGHGGWSNFSNDNLLTEEDVASLNNADKLPVVTALTCMVGHFGLPGFDSLGEVLLLRNNGGAAAVWTFTGLSLNAEAKVMGGEFFRSVFQTRTRILGKAVLKALQDYGKGGGMAYMLDISNLLGDPALIMKIP